MSKATLLLQFDQATEQVKFSEAKLRTVDDDYDTPETRAGHRAIWEEQREKSANAAVAALRELIA